MSYAKPGDHPLMDLLAFGRRRLPDDICDLVLEIYRLDPTAFHQASRNTGAGDGDWYAWEKGERLDEAATFLTAKLKAARAKVGK